MKTRRSADKRHLGLHYVDRTHCCPPELSFHSKSSFFKIGSCVCETRLNHKPIMVVNKRVFMVKLFWQAKIFFILSLHCILCALSAFNELLTLTIHARPLTPGGTTIKMTCKARTLPDFGSVSRAHSGG